MYDYELLLRDLEGRARSIEVEARTCAEKKNRAAADEQGNARDVSAYTLSEQAKS